LKPDAIHVDGTDGSLRRVAWAVWAFEIAIALGALMMAINGRSAPYSGWGFRGFPSVMTLPFATVGVVILSRHPRHAIGWVFLGFGAFAAIQALLFEYMIYGLTLFPGQLPGALTVAWILNSYWLLLLVLMALLVLLFPDGRLPSRRWRLFVWMIVAGVVAMSIWNAFTPGPLDSSIYTLENPYGLETLAPLTDLFNVIIVILLLFAFGIPLVSLILRIRRSQGQQRQQFKWFVFAAALLLIASPSGPSELLIVQSLFIAAVLFLPIAVGIAILRYRLYDIDLIIRRTLAYSVLTGLLVLFYLGSVVLLQSLFRALVGGTSPLAIVISTLGIAALFAPLRRRVQDFIDRRFYRRKYDAAQTLARFAATARQEVELDTLTAELVQVIEETVQPEHVSL
jgi:hypothetical protein